ncbi:MAG: hypothetical protein H7Z14_17205 [Anaerolineae bacterium]|nr:hypothetical protein [Phycisphaerae bacterium]
MNRRISSRPVAVGFALAVLAGASASLAQTGPELLIKPWDNKEQLVEARADAIWLDDGKLREGGDFQLGFYETEGRARLLVGNRADPRFGYNVTYLDIDTDSGALPINLIDTSVAFGVGVLDYEGWQGGITFGLGYAAAGAFDDGNAYYGKADFVIGRKLDETSSIGFVIDYDGNRAAYPDVPLPGFAYTKQIDKTLSYTVGFPFSSVTWKPDPANTFDHQLTLEARYQIPDAFDARIDYELVKEVGVYLAYSERYEAFKWDELTNSNDRLLFQQKRVEGGVIWRPIEQLTFTGAVGYAFSQEFNVGWDITDQDRVAKPSDEPYLRVGLEFRF